MPDMTTSARRDDRGYETSINWEDNASVLTRTRQQPNATHGVARLALAVIVHMQNSPGELAGALSAERRPLPGNPHHGNLVFRNALVRFRQRAIAAYFAVNSNLVPVNSNLVP